MWIFRCCAPRRLALKLLCTHITAGGDEVGRSKNGRGKTVLLFCFRYCGAHGYLVLSATGMTGRCAYAKEARSTSSMNFDPYRFVEATLCAAINSTHLAISITSHFIPRRRRIQCWKIRPNTIDGEKSLFFQHDWWKLTEHLRLWTLNTLCKFNYYFLLSSIGLGHFISIKTIN